MLRRRKPSINLPKNMDREKRIELFIMMIGIIRITFFVKLRSIKTQRQSSIEERKYLNDLYIHWLKNNISYTYLTLIST
jgi:hypothetical protein